jgi:hypothetical protein
MDEVLRPLELEFSLYGHKNKASYVSQTNDSSELELAALRTVGARVLLRWDKEQIGDSGWKTGMFIRYISYSSGKKF